MRCISTLKAGHPDRKIRFYHWNDSIFSEKKGLHALSLCRKMSPLGRLWRRGRLIDPVKENQNTKMLKKYTKYVATAFAVASLSTFMIGCGGDDATEEETGTGTPGEPGTEDTNAPAPATGE